MTRYAVVQPAEGPGQQRIELVDRDEAGSLPWLQEQVGGYIEHVTLAPRTVGMYVHEEGLIRDLPVNPLASMLYMSVGGTTPICGPAVLVGGPDPEGRDTDVPMSLIHGLVRDGITVVGP